MVAMTRNSSESIVSSDVVLKWQVPPKLAMAETSSENIVQGSTKRRVSGECSTTTSCRKSHWNWYWNRRVGLSLRAVGLSAVLFLGCAAIRSEEETEKCHTEQRKLPQLSEKWALIEIMSTSNVRTALREAATRSIDCAHFSILRNGEQTPQGSSSPQRRKYVNSSKALE